jgi:hypothetical protein
MTRRERNRWIAKGIQLGVILLASVYGYVRLKGLMPP